MLITEALAIWGNAARVMDALTPAQRADEFDMGNWGVRRPNPCRTAACLAGWCSLDQWFRDKGFEGRWTPSVLRPDQQVLKFSIPPDAFFGRFSTVFMEGGDYDEVREAVDAILARLGRAVAEGQTHEFEITGVLMERVVREYRDMREPRGGTGQAAPPVV